jgi:hypothetical protein
MRYAAVVAMFALAVAAALLPTPEAPRPDSAPGSEVAPVAICPVVEAGETHTDVSVLSSVSGQGRLSTFAAGSETGALEFRTGGTGAVTIPAVEADAVGVAGGLVEMPSEATAAGVLVTGPDTRSAESCADIPTGQSFIAGGSTISGAFFEVQLINPYAGDATVDLTVSSDAGLESDDRFNAVVVPALSTITLDLTQIIPGRQSISAEVDTARGSVLAFGRQTIDGKTALWRAVAPGQDWWLPVPPGRGIKQMRIATPENAEIQYQVDLYGPDGFVEGHDTGVIDQRGSVTVPLAAVTTEAAGVRVITTGPAVPALWIDSPDGLARTTGSQVDASVWLLPGASGPGGGGSGSITILNSGIETVDVSIRRLSGSSTVSEVQVAAEGVLVADLMAADGYRVEASGPIVALWTSTVDGSGTAAIGIPIQDG